MKRWVFLLDEPMFSMERSNVSIQRCIVLMERWMFSMKHWAFLLDKPMFSMERRIVSMERRMFSMERWVAGMGDVPANREPGGFV